MKKLFLSMLLLICSTVFIFAQLPEGFSQYKLDNGLTVLLWEDHDQPDVFGATVTRAGSIDEPETRAPTASARSIGRKRNPTTSTSSLCTTHSP